MQFRDLPSVDRVMASDGMAALTETYPRDWVVDLVRRELDRARQQIRDGGKAPSAGMWRMVLAGNFGPSMKWHLAR